jgi:hypothetical protein
MLFREMAYAAGTGMYVTTCVCLCMYMYVCVCMYIHASLNFVHNATWIQYAVAVTLTARCAYFLRILHRLVCNTMDTMQYYHSITIDTMPDMNSWPEMRNTSKIRQNTSKYFDDYVHVTCNLCIEHTVMFIRYVTYLNGISHLCTHRLVPACCLLA